MVGRFFGKTDHVATVPLVQRSTINSEWYTTISLEKFEQRTRKDESVFTMAQVSAFLTGQNVDLLGQPPHSPDLAPMTSFYFRTSKKYCVVIR